LFANKNYQTQMTAHNAPISLSQLDGSPPIMR
jgi:hypothetical protein